MARVKKANDESAKKLIARANVRLAPDELAELRVQSDAAGLTLSNYVRRRIFSRKVVAQTDVQVVNELRRLGVLLTSMHVQTDRVYRAEIAGAISSIREAIDRLALS